MTKFLRSALRISRLPSTRTRFSMAVEPRADGRCDNHCCVVAFALRSLFLVSLVYICSSLLLCYFGRGMK